jgi:hypothetical protein
MPVRALAPLRQRNHGWPASRTLSIRDRPLGPHPNPQDRQGSRILCVLVPLRERPAPGIVRNYHLTRIAKYVRYPSPMFFCNRIAPSPAVRPHRRRRQPRARVHLGPPQGPFRTCEGPKRTRTEPEKDLPGTLFGPPFSVSQCPPCVSKCLCHHCLRFSESAETTSFPSPDTQQPSTINYQLCPVKCPPVHHRGKHETDHRTLGSGCFLLPADRL